MVRMFIRHPVEDYDRWRRGFDDFQPTAKELGVQGADVFRAAEDPNDVTVIHDFHDADGARSFLDSDEVKQAMGEAGVVGAPQIWLTERA